MKKRNNKKGKTKKKKENKSNNQSFSEDNSINEFSILNNSKEINSIIIDDEINNFNQIEENENHKEEESQDIFENALLLMDKRVKDGLCFNINYEPNFSINYPENKFETVPIFTPSISLNKALQIVDKSECYFYYYTQKKTLYPTIYNQIIGISGPKILNNKPDKDFIFANLTSIIFTNQKNFINLNTLINEYINPIMKKYKISQEEKKYFIEELFKNIIIQEYFSYEELLIKLNELNIQFIEHKLNNVGLIIIDGINSINPHSLDIIEQENPKRFQLKFFKYSTYKFEQYEEKKNRNNNLQGKRNSKYENNNDVKENIYGNDWNKKNFDCNKNYTNNEKYQQNIVNLIISYQEKYKFNTIITVFDFSQDNYYNSCFGGKIAYKGNKNVYCNLSPELRRENCYFTFKLSRNFFPRKIVFLEPINLCVNYNNNIFGMLVDIFNSHKLVLFTFKKNVDDYRPIKITEMTEYSLQ